MFRQKLEIERTQYQALSNSGSQSLRTGYRSNPPPTLPRPPGPPQSMTPQSMTQQWAPPAGR